MIVREQEDTESIPHLPGLNEHIIELAWQHYHSVRVGRSGLTKIWFSRLDLIVKLLRTKSHGYCSCRHARSCNDQITAALG